MNTQFLRIESRSVLGLLAKSAWLSTQIRLRKVAGPKNPLNFTRQIDRTPVDTQTEKNCTLDPGLLSARLKPTQNVSKSSPKFDTISADNESGFNSEADAGQFSRDGSECSSPPTTPGSFTFHELASLLKSEETTDSVENQYEKYESKFDENSPVLEADDLPLATAWNVSLNHKNKKDPKTPTGKVAYPGYIKSLFGFWRAVNNLPLPTELVIKHRQELAFFRNDVQPTWESPENKDGGFFRVVFDRSAYERKVSRNVMVLNETWIEVLMALVGETVPHAEYLTGCAFKPRQQEDRIEIWTSDMRFVMDEQRAMEEYLSRLMARFGRVEYVTHEENRQYFASFNPSTSFRKSNGLADS